jgi:hypothetical protein
MGQVRFPRFIEGDGGFILDVQDGDVWQVGRAHYAHIAEQWFRLGKNWDNNLEGNRVQLPMWLPSRGPRSGSMGTLLHEGPQKGRRSPLLRLVVDNSAKE